MDIDFGRVIEAISLFNTDPYKISSNFDSFPKDCQDSLKLTMAEVAMLLYHFFKIKNMFDFNVSEQTANNISETIDRVRYRAMQTAQADMLENNIKSYKFDGENYTFEISNHYVN
jgi:TRAP-type mannitol/chloroaromatic compound transport system substrate-binding protein